MFTYIDPSVRERLIVQGKLVRIDTNGVLIAPDSPSTGSGSITVLGPIPLPLELNNTRTDVQWYACVRNTELSKIEKIADDLRAQDGQQQ